MAGTSRTSSFARYIAGALIGGMLVLIAAISVWPEPFPYPDVIVPAAAIRAREIPFTAPGPWDIGTRIRYVYVSPDIRAVAPASVKVDVERFCRPVLIPDTTSANRQPSPSVIRTLSWSPAILPMSKGNLLVTSMDGYGDLIAEDYRVRAPFGVAAGLEEPYRTVVRYDRTAIGREMLHAALWYLPLRLAEAIFIK